MSEKITFTDLIDKIAEETGASKRLIRDLLREMVNLTKEGLAEDGRVNFTGLGHFDLKWHDVRPGKNPQTGETIEIPAQSRVNFKPEAALRDYINRKYKHLKPIIIDDEIVEDVPFEGEEQQYPETELPTVPVEQQIPPIEDKHKSRKMPAWLWLIVPLIVIAIILFLWPSKEQPEPVAEDTKILESVVEEVADVTEEPQQPVEEPASTEEKGLSESVVEEVADATEEPRQPVEVPVPAKEDESVSESVVEEVASATEKPSQPAEEPVPVKVRIPGGQHRVQPGDKIWNLAENYYFEAYLWPNIYRVNLTEIDNPDELIVGINILVPPLEGKVGNLTNNDIANIVEGYIQAYLIYRKLGKSKAYYYLWVAKQYDVSQVFNQFNNKIDEADLELVKNIEGTSRIK